MARAARGPAVGAPPPGRREVAERYPRCPGGRPPQGAKTTTLTLTLTLTLTPGAASDREELALALAACACTSAEAEAWAEGDSALDDPFAAQWAPLLAATADEDRNAAIQSDVNQAFKRLTLSSAGPRKPPSAAEAAPGGTKAAAPAFVAPTPRSFCQPCR